MVPAFKPSPTPPLPSPTTITTTTTAYMEQMYSTEMAAEELHKTEPFDDFIFGPVFCFSRKPMELLSWTQPNVWSGGCSAAAH